MCVELYYFIVHLKSESIVIAPASFFFFNLFIFNWRITALQYCISLCPTSVWISHRYTHVASLWNLTLTSHHPAPLGCHRAPDLSFLHHTAYSYWLSILHWRCICFHAILSIHPTLSFLHCVHMFVFYVCISIAVLQIGSSVPSF